MPSSDKVVLKWQGIVQVIESSSTKVSSGWEGAIIIAGVAKILTIYSVAPKGTLLFVYVVVLIVIIAVLVAIYVAVARMRKPAHKGISKAALESMPARKTKAQGVAAGRKKASGMKRGRPSVKRKPARKARSASKGRRASRKNKPSSKSRSAKRRQRGA